MEEEGTVPYFAISNSELAESAELAKPYVCVWCDTDHEVFDSTPAEGEKGSTTLHFVKCVDGATRIVGINGKDITWRFRKDTNE